MSSFALTLPDELEKRAAAQAQESGMSLNDYISTILASRLEVQAELQRQFTKRAARIEPGRARGVLAKAGRGNPPLPGDELDE